MAKQARLGQCKLIDGMIDAKIPDEKIYSEIREKLPEYPEKKLKNLIKTRHWHVARRAK